MQKKFRTNDFDFVLPPELIAQAPLAERDAARLMVVQRSTSRISHQKFPDLLGHLRANDVLVLNDSRVIRARLRGKKEGTGGQIEMLLLEENGVNDWWVMLKPGKRVHEGTTVRLSDLLGRETQVLATVRQKNSEGHCRIQFGGVANLVSELDRLGETPLPPYITRDAEGAGVDDSNRYQTVFAEASGSVAAPTAGLHFSRRLLDEIQDRGVQIRFVTLHIGLGTFSPVKSEFIDHHIMHEEKFTLRQCTADAINAVKQTGGRVIAVGTTTVRVLESVAAANAGRLVGATGQTRIFIYPPWRFHIADALVTNFHLPHSTLLMLVSAFMAPGETRGRDLALDAYKEAVQQRYRFFSYGDAMLIL